MNKHTPGPWSKTGQFTISARRAKTIDIGEVYFGGTERCQAEYEEAAANALLIAAAPELLEACKRASYFFMIDSPMDFEDAETECDIVRSLCRIAVAKAEGTD